MTVELKDYSMMTGQFDKIASIGMYEHIGLKNIPGYMAKMQQLLAKDGLFLNHAIARRAPKQGWFKRAHAARAEGDRQVHLPRRRARRHRPLDLRHGARRLRDPGRRGVAAALCAHLQAVVRAADGQPRRGAEARQRREVPHLGCLSRRRVAGVLARHATHLPDAGVEERQAPAGHSARRAPTSIARSLRTRLRCNTRPHSRVLQRCDAPTLFLRNRART